MILPEVPVIETIATYVAPAATMIAAIMTAANLGARVTGWGFVVFTIGAIAWVIQGMATGQQNLIISNGFLLAIDLFGIWRWLGRQGRYDEGARAAHRRSRRAPVPTLFQMGGLNGATVRDEAGTTLGVAVEAMASCEDGRIAYVVVSCGGIGGVGETLHALGWNEVRYKNGDLVTTLDAETLDDRPAFVDGAWPETMKAAGIG